MRTYDTACHLAKQPSLSTLLAFQAEDEINRNVIVVSVGHVKVAVVTCASVKLRLTAASPEHAQDHQYDFSGKALRYKQ